MHQITSKYTRWIAFTLAVIILFNVTGMNAAVAAGLFASVEQAQDAMSSGFDSEYIPNQERHQIYNKLYRRYLDAAYGI